MCADLEQARGNRPTCSWSHHIATCMRNTHCHDEAECLLSGQPVDQGRAETCFAEALMDRAWGRLPSGTPSVREVPDAQHDGFKKWTYKRWFEPEEGCLAGYVYGLHDRTRITTTARFRMSSHSLGVETGRWVSRTDAAGKRVREPVARSQRFCASCCSGHGSGHSTACTREDEWHVLVCPAYADLRIKYFGSDDYFSHAQDDASINAILNGTRIKSDRDWRRHWLSLSAYLVDMNAQRINNTAS